MFLVVVAAAQRGGGAVCVLWSDHSIMMPLNPTLFAASHNGEVVVGNPIPI